MTAIIIAILLLVLFVILLTIIIYSRKKERLNIRHNPVLEQYQNDYLFDETVPGTGQADFIADKKGFDTFDNITSLIKNNFHPISFTNDEDYEKLLINFLMQNLPNNIVMHGHTKSGNKLDIVIDGTYAFELIVADSEEKLLYLMDLSLKSKKEFDKTAVIIVDVKKIPSPKIQEFATQIEKIGIKAIVVETNY